MTLKPPSCRLFSLLLLSALPPPFQPLTQNIHSFTIINSENHKVLRSLYAVNLRTAADIFIYPCTELPSAVRPQLGQVGNIFSLFYPTKRRLKTNFPSFQICRAFGTLQHTMCRAPGETMGGVGEALGIPVSACLGTMVTLCLPKFIVKSKHQHRNEACCLLKPPVSGIYRSFATSEALVVAL